MTMQMEVHAPVPNVIFAWKATSIHEWLAFTAPVCNTLIRIISHTNTETFGTYIERKFETCTDNTAKSALSLFYVEL